MKLRNLVAALLIAVLIATPVSAHGRRYVTSRTPRRTTASTITVRGGITTQRDHHRYCITHTVQRSKGGGWRTIATGSVCTTVGSGGFGVSWAMRVHCKGPLGRARFRTITRGTAYNESGGTAHFATTYSRIAKIRRTRCV